MSYSHKVLVLLLLLVGLAARVYLANEVSLSPDERNVTNKFLDIPFQNVFTITTLHGFPEHAFANLLIWTADKVGKQIYILRWPGIVFGVLALAMTYKLTRHMLGSTYALVVTFLFSFSAYHLLFAHRIRGYAEMIFLVVASFYFLWRGMKRPAGRRNWLFFALVTGLGIYNHFFTTTVLATQGLIIACWLGLHWWQQRPQVMGAFLRQQALPPLLGGVGSLAVAVILFAPLLPQFLQNARPDDSHFAVSSTSWLETVWPYLNLFDEYSSATTLWGSVLFIMLLLAGIIHLLRVKPAALGVLLGWLLVPILIAALGQILIPWFYVRERYIVYMLPAYLMLIAAGWVGLFQWLRRCQPALGIITLILSLALFFTLSSTALADYYRKRCMSSWQQVAKISDPKRPPTDMFICEPFEHGWKEEVDLPSTDRCTRNVNYRLGNYLENDPIPFANLYKVATYQTFAENPILLERNPRLWVIVWNMPKGYEVHGVTPAATFTRLGHTAILGPFTAENSMAAMAQAVEQTTRLVMVPGSETSQSTQFVLLTRLAGLYLGLGQPAAAAEALSRAKVVMPTDKRATALIAEFEQRLDAPPLIVSPAHPLAANLNGQIRLRGYTLTPQPPLPGQPLRLTLFWQALAAIDTDYTVFLHLRNEADQTVAQIDFTPARSTSSWWVGDTPADSKELILPPDLPPGQYRLLAGLYNPQTLERLAVQNDASGENAIELTQFVISK
ncbi:MAG: glycosyltransferase family 39 protein [Anaerolineae bacterium]